MTERLKATWQKFKLFMDSFNQSAQELARTIDQANDNSLRLEPKNYDVGVITPAGTYRLDDETQAYWLRLLASKHFSTVTPSIRAELLGYYNNLDAPIATKRNTNEWSQLVMQLQELKAIPSMQTATTGGQ